MVELIVMQGLLGTAVVAQINLLIAFHTETTDSDGARDRHLRYGALGILDAKRPDPTGQNCKNFSKAAIMFYHPS